jgi:hypothetical protein
MEADMKPEPFDNWALDKRINLSNLLTACVVAISIIWWAAQIEKRVAVLEVELTAFYNAQLQGRQLQFNRDDKQDTEVDKLEVVMREGFARLNDKLDKLIANR